MEESYLLERERLRTMLKSSEKRISETEVQMRYRTDELDLEISELSRTYTFLEEKLMKLESEKMMAFDSHRNEKEVRVALERTQASLAEALERTEQGLNRANQKIESLNASYKNSQDYNTGLQQYNSKLQRDSDSYKASFEHLEQEKSVMIESLAMLQGKYGMLQDELSSFQDSKNDVLKETEVLTSEAACMKAELQKVRDERDSHYLQAQALTAEVLQYKERTGRSYAELDNLTTKSNALEVICSSQAEKIRLLQRKVEAANDKLQMADLNTMESRTEFEEQKRLAWDLQNRIEDAKFQIMQADKLHKDLYNTILELKGNIRVFCRVRPLLRDDGADTEITVFSYPQSVELVGRAIDLTQSGQRHQFSFDKVFNPEESQEEVFAEISQLLQNAVDGHKVCVFAYGQTGSGKTYTMMGNPEFPEERGLIPRSVEQIFRSMKFLASQGWKHSVQASMLEICNDNIQDLLATSQVGGLDNGTAVTGKQYTIRHDASIRNTHVSNLTIMDVHSVEDISPFLHQAAQCRSVRKNQMNEKPPKSHFIFTLRISGVNESTEQQLQGVLNLVDLASTDPPSNGSGGDQLRETQVSDKNLSSLTDVISALAKKEDYIPFKNSKLTHLLQPCLAGDSKTLMFVNISPDLSSVDESLCSLRFAAKVNACEIRSIRPRQTNARPTDSRLSFA
ncbi:hypothetical protein Syun_027064 [Stephania yunnanensis]|uniref:Kinesin motor domain-containing protein n=1 Tax=Stephania yunnanensis TaxID=152371 RepID=A0AAP0EM94_9MAGN